MRTGCWRILAHKPDPADLRYKGEMPGDTISCPRCGESFSYRRPTEDEPELPSGATAAGTSAGDRLARPVVRRPSNRAMAAAVLGLMLIMALISLVVGLKTVSFR